ncbi:MAG: hypothetical protein JW770_03910 [Actinobacteria bacterium]|nr:hypothetical protein [Actinomycetota bacterium]
MEQQFTGAGGFFVIFRIAQFMPYVAIGLLIVMAAIWVVFGIKKSRWAKILAIVLTALVLITGLCSFAPYVLRTFMGGQLPEGGFPQGDFPEVGIRRGGHPEGEFPGDTQRSRDQDRKVNEVRDTGTSLWLPGNMDPAGRLAVI